MLTMSDSKNGVRVGCASRRSLAGRKLYLVAWHHLKKNTEATGTSNKASIHRRMSSVQGHTHLWTRRPVDLRFAEEISIHIRTPSDVGTTDCNDRIGMLATPSRLLYESTFMTQVRAVVVDGGKPQCAAGRVPVPDGVTQAPAIAPSKSISGMVRGIVSPLLSALSQLLPLICLASCQSAHSAYMGSYRDTSFGPDCCLLRDANTSSARSDGIPHPLAQSADDPC